MLDPAKATHTTTYCQSWRTFCAKNLLKLVSLCAVLPPEHAYEVKANEISNDSTIKY